MSHRSASFSLIVFTAMVFLSGCAKEDETASNPATTTTAGAHAHAAGDKLVWPLKETIADHEIWFGHHGNHFHGGEKIEPAISITKGGQSVDNAQVFSGLVNTDNAETAGEVSTSSEVSTNSEASTTGEVPTTYEPATNAEIAHYAQAELAIPADAKQITIRYRVKLPYQPDEFTREVTVKVGH